MLKSKKDYIESLRKQKLEVYMFGKKISGIVDNPSIIPSIRRKSKTPNIDIWWRKSLRRSLVGPIRYGVF